jgi:hypothetical protein
MRDERVKRAHLRLLRFGMARAVADAIKLVPATPKTLATPIAVKTAILFPFVMQMPGRMPARFCARRDPQARYAAALT